MSSSSKYRPPAQKGRGTLGGAGSPGGAGQPRPRPLRALRSLRGARRGASLNRHDEWSGSSLHVELEHRPGRATLQPPGMPPSPRTPYSPKTSCVLATCPLPLGCPDVQRRKPDVRAALVHRYEPCGLFPAARSRRAARASSSHSEAAIVFARRSTRACGLRGSSSRRWRSTPHSRSPRCSSSVASWFFSSWHHRAWRLRRWHRCAAPFAAT